MERNATSEESHACEKKGETESTVHMRHEPFSCDVTCSTSSVHHNIEPSVTGYKENHTDEINNGSFFQNYFSNHSNSLPSRLSVNMRRLSQCREEDEDEEKSDIVPSSNMSTISGSDKSLSESSTGSKTSVIDTISGPTHKFVITKSKPGNTIVKDGEKSTKKELSEGAKLFASQKKYRQANTVHGISSYDPKRPSINTLFKSPMQSPHYDSIFFDSSLIEMKSNNSSSSTVNCSSTEDIWVKRSDLDVKQVSHIFG